MQFIRRQFSIDVGKHRAANKCRLSLRESCVFPFFRRAKDDNKKPQDAKPFLWGLVFGLTLAVGCSKEDLNKMVDTVQSKTSAVVQETVAKVMPMGSVQLSIDEGLDIPVCSARLLSLGMGRQSILQLKSYGDDDRDAVKSVLFQGKTSATSVQELVGQTVTGQLFAQSNKETGLWQSDSEGPTSIKILAIQDTELVGEILQSKMVRADGKSGYPSGSFRAVFVKP